MVVSGYNERIGAWDASTEAARIVTDNLTDQNVRALFMGEPGAGKSVMCLLYDYNSACNISEINHKEPDRWHEYFNLDENVAVADRDKLIEIINKDFNKGSIIMADELQMMANSRDFKDLENRIVNMYYQLMRPNRMILSGTIQEQFAQDKQSRRLYTHFFDMGKLHAYEYGANFGKCKYPSIDPTNTNKTMYPFPRDNGRVINMLCGLLPPQELLKDYVKIRSEAMKKLRDEKTKELKELMELKQLKKDKMLNPASGNCPICHTSNGYRKKNGIWHCRKCNEDV